MEVEVENVLGVDVKLDRLVRVEPASVDLEMNRSIVRLLRDADRNLEGASHFESPACRAGGRAVSDPAPFLPLATKVGGFFARRSTVEGKSSDGDDESKSRLDQ